MKLPAFSQLSILAALFCHLPLAQATDPGTIWSAYPTCAVTDCLNPITTASTCETTDNACFCTNLPFITDLATCLGKNCASIVLSTYRTYASTCTSGGYAVALTDTEFLAQAGTLSSFLTTTFWASYPTCAIGSCLTPLTLASKCEVDDNGCVCGNSTFLGQLAQCVGKACDSTTAASIYTQFSTTCTSNGGYSMALSNAQWNVDAGIPVGTGGGGTTTSVTDTDPSNSSPAGFTTRTSSPISSADSTPGTSSVSSTPSTTRVSKSSGGYDEDQKISLGVGIGIGLPATVVSIIMLWIMCFGSNRRFEPTFWTVKKRQR